MTVGTSNPQPLCRKERTSLPSICPMSTPVLAKTPAPCPSPGASLWCSQGVMGFYPLSYGFHLIVNIAENTRYRHVIVFSSKQPQREALALRQQRKSQEGQMLHPHLEMMLPPLGLHLKVGISLFWCYSGQWLPCQACLFCSTHECPWHVSLPLSI